MQSPSSQYDREPSPTARPPFTGSVALAGRLFVIAVLVLSGIGKFIDPAPAAMALMRVSALGYEFALRSIYSISSAEIIIAVGLCLPSRTGLLVHASGALLSLGFATFTLQRIADGDTAACGCFGALLPDLDNTLRLILASVLLGYFALMGLSLRRPRNAWNGGGPK